MESCVMVLCVVSFAGLLVVRHSGVLGLAALVEACPYSVPEWLPEVVDELALHLHDPAPIQVRRERAKGNSDEISIAHTCVV